MQADQWIGTVRFNEELNTYVIRYFLPRSIDSVFEGIACGIPTDLQQEGQRLKFSGNYRAYTGPVQPQLGGLKYFNLEVTAISVL